jgi:hypothetical protein
LLVIRVLEKQNATDNIVIELQSYLGFHRNPMIWHDGLKMNVRPRGGRMCCGFIPVLGLFLGAGLNPHPGRFKAIKSFGAKYCWLFYLLGITRCAREP